MLLNLVAPLDSAVPCPDFEQINVFWTCGFDFVSIVFDSVSVSRSLPDLYFSHSIPFPSSDLERVNIWFMALIAVVLHSFLLLFAQFQLFTRFRSFFFDFQGIIFAQFVCICCLFITKLSLVILGQISPTRWESWYRNLEFCFTSFLFYYHQLWWNSWHAMLTLFLL